MINLTALKGLARRADVRTTTSDAGFLDSCPADRAGFSRSGEDLELVLELTALTKRVVVGVKGRAAQLDGSLQYISGRGVDSACLLGGEGGGLTGGVDAGAEEHLIHVDVPEPGDHGLVEEQALYGSFTRERTSQILD